MFYRIMVYFKEMFPLSSIFGTIFTGVIIELIYLNLYSLKINFDLKLLAPATVLTLVGLLIRIMDEFKDYEDDLKNFPNRPLPSGKVKKEDLKILGVLTVIGILVLSAISVELFAFSIVTLFYTFLMLKWFFIEDKMKKSLPLALLTHHPIVLFNFAYLVIACNSMYPVVDYSKSYYILPLCLMFTNWEISRKIRSPENETEYTTYSKIWGAKTATFVSMLLQLGFAISVVIIFNVLKTPIILTISYVIAFLVLLSFYLKFFFKLKSSVILKNIAELQIVTVLIFLLTAVQL